MHLYNIILQNPHLCDLIMKELFLGLLKSKVININYVMHLGLLSFIVAIDVLVNEDKPIEEKQLLEELNSKLMEVEETKIEIYKEYGQKQKIVSQLFDLALLSNNLLKGESLSNFVSRSVDLLKK